MPRLTTQNELRQARKLTVCYLCGESLDGLREEDRDHVPPESIFAEGDRSPPLILRVHVSCNQKESVDDEVISQLVGVLHGKYVRQERIRLEVKAYRIEDEDKTMGGVVNVRIPSIIWRWVRGFHAALYGEYLPDKTKHKVHPPLWRFSEDGQELKPDPPLPQEPVFVQRIKANRAAGAIDEIITCSGQCVYVCTWEQADRGQQFCMFALRLYGWERLSVESFPQRGCVGTYVPAAGMPKTGTKATRLEFPIDNKSIFDPFGR